MRKFLLLGAAVLPLAACETGFPEPSVPPSLQFQSEAPPEESILAWQIATLDKWTERMPVAAAAFPHLTIVRLRHPREAERWLRAQAEASGASIAPPKRRSRDR